MEIGFIGLGNMGFHMARRLVEAGHRLVVDDTRPQAVARLTDSVRRPRHRRRRSPTGSKP